MSNFLFSIDSKSDEIIVSESPKGSNQLNFIERISRENNENLYNSVATLTIITNSSPLDMRKFKSIDKVCQIIYRQHIGKS